MRNTLPSPVMTHSQPSIHAPWDKLIPDDQWAVFIRGTHALRDVGVANLLGGALALATYTAHWRNTKDVDVIIRPSARETAIEALRGAGFDDYYEHEAYDRSWIFRGFSNGVLFDVIWELPNHRVAIDDPWFERARTVQIRGQSYAAVPPEELIRVKLYVMQRERCDWVDVLNVLGGAFGSIDWSWLVRRMGQDLPLLQAALTIFSWLCPGRASTLPQWLREQFALPVVDCRDASETEVHRVRLFDSRPWFAMHQPLDRILER
jgi:hypothetical protein